MEVRSKEEYTVDDKISDGDYSPDPSFYEDNHSSAIEPTENKDHIANPSMEGLAEASAGSQKSFDHQEHNSDEKSSINRGPSLQSAEKNLRPNSRSSLSPSQTNQSAMPLNDSKKLRSRSPQPSAEAKARWALLASLAGVSHDEPIAEKDAPTESAKEIETMIKRVWSDHDKPNLDDLEDSGRIRMPDHEAFLAPESERNDSIISKRGAGMEEDKMRHTSSVFQSSHTKDAPSQTGNERSHVQYEHDINDILKKADEEMAGVEHSSVDVIHEGMISVDKIGEAIKDDHLKTVEKPVEGILKSLKQDVERDFESGKEHLETDFAGRKFVTKAKEAELAVTHGAKEAEHSAMHVVGEVRKDIIDSKMDTELGEISQNAQKDIHIAESLATDVHTGGKDAKKLIEESLNNLESGFKKDVKQSINSISSDDMRNFAKDDKSKVEAGIKNISGEVKDSLIKAIDQSRIPLEGRQVEQSLERGKQLIKKSSQELENSRLGSKINYEAKSLGDKAKDAKQSFTADIRRSEREGTSDLRAGIQTAQQFVRRTNPSQPPAPIRSYGEMQVNRFPAQPPNAMAGIAQRPIQRSDHPESQHSHEHAQISDAQTMRPIQATHIQHSNKEHDGSQIQHQPPSEHAQISHPDVSHQHQPTYDQRPKSGINHLLPQEQNRLDQTKISHSQGMHQTQPTQNQRLESKDNRSQLEHHEPPKTIHEKNEVPKRLPRDQSQNQERPVPPEHSKSQKPASVFSGPQQPFPSQIRTQQQEKRTPNPQQKEIAPFIPIRNPAILHGQPQETARLDDHPRREAQGGDHRPIIPQTTPKATPLIHRAEPEAQRQPQNVERRPAQSGPIKEFKPPTEPISGMRASPSVVNKPMQPVSNRDRIPHPDSFPNRQAASTGIMAKPLSSSERREKLASEMPSRVMNAMVPNNGNPSAPIHQQGPIRQASPRRDTSGNEVAANGLSRQHDLRDTTPSRESPRMAYPQQQHISTHAMSNGEEQPAPSSMNAHVRKDSAPAVKRESHTPTPDTKSKPTISYPSLGKQAQPMPTAHSTSQPYAPTHPSPINFQHQLPSSHSAISQAETQFEHASSASTSTLPNHSSPHHQHPTQSPQNGLSPAQSYANYLEAFKQQSQAMIGASAGGGTPGFLERECFPLFHPPFSSVNVGGGVIIGKLC